MISHRCRCAGRAERMLTLRDREHAQVSPSQALAACAQLSCTDRWSAETGASW